MMFVDASAVCAITADATASTATSVVAHAMRSVRTRPLRPFADSGDVFMYVRPLQIGPSRLERTTTRGGGYSADISQRKRMDGTAF